MVAVVDISMRVLQMLYLRRLWHQMHRLSPHIFEECTVAQIIIILLQEHNPAQLDIQQLRFLELLMWIISYICVLVVLRIQQRLYQHNMLNSVVCGEPDEYFLLAF